MDEQTKINIALNAIKMEETSEPTRKAAIDYLTKHYKQKQSSHIETVMNIKPQYNNLDDYGDYPMVDEWGQPIDIDQACDSEHYLEIISSDIDSPINHKNKSFWQEFWDSRPWKK